MDTPLFYVNAVEVHGSLNGVVNLLFSTAKFSPGESNDVKVTKYLAVDLRFDLFCAQQVHDALGKILAEQTKPATKPN